MKSNKRKIGGAYRRRKRAISLHAKAGKDRSKSTSQATVGRQIEIQVKLRGLNETEQKKKKAD